MGPDIDMKFHQEVMEIVSYDIYNMSPKMLPCAPVNLEALATLQTAIPIFMFSSLMLGQFCFPCEFQPTVTGVFRRCLCSMGESVHREIYVDIVTIIIVL